MDGILGYFNDHPTSAPIETVSGASQVARAVIPEKDGIARIVGIIYVT